MNEELILAGLNLFDSADKWSSFLELVEMSDEIQERWWQKLQSELYQRELKNPTPGWDIYVWDISDIMWFIKGQTFDTLAIHFNKEYLSLSSYNDLDVDIVKELLENSKFDILRSCFDRIDADDETYGEEYKIASERGNFYFDSIYDGQFENQDMLSWSAGNRTREFADQIIAKVRKFQTPEITKLFQEINRKCKVD